jgi:hypothetical protein
VLNETHLRRLLRDYLAYYHSVRTHLSLDKDSPARPSPTRPRRGDLSGAAWGHRSLVDGELLAQGEVLEDELAGAAAEKGEKSH